MGTLADSLFTVLMSWVRGLVSALWALFSSDHTTALEFLGKNWLLIAAVLIAAGLVIDWIIWLLRWQPYHLWAQRARRLLRIEEPEDEEEEPAAGKAHAAVMPRKREPVQETPRQPWEDEGWEDAQDVPLYLGEQDAQMAMQRAQSAPDEYAYPGMRFDSAAPQGMDSTQRYSAVTQTGPGAAEVERRRAEIDAWQLQMQEEARARAEAERAAREAEQARLAQEEYERQMAEYERQRAQYERDLAEYERQKAAYDAQMAQEAAAQQMQETAEELVPEQSASRRRGARRPHGDAAGRAGSLPQTPRTEPQSSPAQTKAGSGLLGRMAKMMEEEEEQLAARPKLPPRVDMHEAYRTPARPGRRNPHI